MLTLVVRLQSQRKDERGASAVEWLIVLGGGIGVAYFAGAAAWSSAKLLSTSGESRSKRRSKRWQPTPNRQTMSTPSERDARAHEQKILVARFFPVASENKTSEQKYAQAVYKACQGQKCHRKSLCKNNMD